MLLWTKYHREDLYSPTQAQISSNPPIAYNLDYICGSFILDLGSTTKQNGEQR